MNKIGNSFKKTVRNVILIGIVFLNVISCSNDEYFEDVILDAFAKQDRINFSDNIAQNEVVQNIFARRGIEDVRGWFYDKMSARYFFRPNLVERDAGGAFSPWSGNIYFANIEEARREALRAHERSHEVSHQSIDNNRYRVGFVVSGRNDRLHERDENGFSEGVTCHFAAKLMGISFEQYLEMMGGVMANTNGQDAGMVNEFRQKLNCDETLFEAFLFDPKILHKEVNRRLNCNQAWDYLMRVWGVWHRHNRETIFNRDFMRSANGLMRYEAAREAAKKAGVVRAAISRLQIFCCCDWDWWWGDWYTRPNGI